MKSDRVAGNLSDAKKFRLRKKNRRFNDFLSPDDQTDLFFFDLKKSSSVKLKLKRLQENANLELYEIKGRERRAFRKIGGDDLDTLSNKKVRKFLNRLARSKKRGTKNEKISIDLNEGTYFIRVSYAEKQGEHTRYRLIGKAKPLPPDLGGGSNTPEVARWVRQFGTDQDDYAYGIDVDSSGNVYVAGTTAGTLSGATSSGDRDNFVTKYDRNGNLLWRRQFGTTEDDIIFDIAVNDAGDYVVAGAMISDVSFSLSGIAGGVDGFVAKYDRDGNQLWFSFIPESERLVDVTTSNPFISAPNTDAGDAISSIEIDAAGNVFVSGFTKAVPETTQTFGGFTISVDSNDAEAFVAKYNGSNGSNIWYESFSGGSGSSASADLGLDADGNIYIAGVTAATLQEDSDDPFVGGDVFVAKFDGAGNQLFFDTLTSAEANTRDYARSLTVDADGFVYIAGETGGTLPGQTSAGDTDGFVVKYDMSGASAVREWVRQFGTSGSDEAQAIAIASDNTLYVTGETSGSLYGTHAGGTDTWLVAYNSTGTVTRSTQFGTSSDEEAYRLAVDGSDRPYLVGQTRGSLQPGVVNQGLYDAWIDKNPDF